jgi:hypothetical protein
MAGNRSVRRAGDRPREDVHATGPGCLGDRLSADLTPMTSRRRRPEALAPPSEGPGGVVLMHPRMAEAAERALSTRQRHVHALALRGWGTRRIAIALGLPASVVARETSRAAGSIAGALDAA